MSYSNKNDFWLNIVCIIIVLLVIFGINASNKSTWNDGVCPNCEVRYELRAAVNSIQHYVCPKCGEKVKRIWTIFN